MIDNEQSQKGKSFVFNLRQIIKQYLQTFTLALKSYNQPRHPLPPKESNLKGKNDWYFDYTAN
jgi:hypothetical protein